MSSRIRRGNTIGESSPANGASLSSGRSTASSSRAMNRAIPQDLSFIFTVRHLDPDYTIQKVQRTPRFHWMPPTKRNAFKPGELYLFHWVGGRVHERDASLRGAHFDSATVFTHMVDSGHLLAVELDAQEIDVESTDQGWRELSFHHEQEGNSGRTYSNVVALGPEDKIAAPSRHLKTQLLPQIYDCQQADTSVTNAGLIGSLPILLAMAAFTAAPDHLATVFTKYVEPGVWRNHPPLGNGHAAERGMVVKVYLDPSNQGSTKERLEKLRKGDYGPFYAD